MRKKERETLVNFKEKKIFKKIFCQETSQGLSELKVNLKHTSTYIKDKIEDAYIEERT